MHRSTPCIRSGVVMGVIGAFILFALMLGLIALFGR